MVDTSWNTFIQELDAFIERHGHANVSQSATTQFTTTKPYPLGRKVNETRTRYSRGTLTQDRTKQLNGRPGWAWRAAQTQWQQKLDQVGAYYAKHGTLTGMPPNLRQWLLRQRWDAQASKLDPQQLEQLATVTAVLHPESFEDFIAAVETWLQQNPGATTAHIKRREKISTPKHPNYALGARNLYYRRRRAGLEGRTPLSDADAARLEQVPGWSWTGPTTHHNH